MLKTFGNISKVAAVLTWIGGFIAGIALSGNADAAFLVLMVCWVSAFLTGSMYFAIGLIATELEFVSEKVNSSCYVNERNAKIITDNQMEISNDLKSVVRIVRKLEPKE